MSHYLGWTKRDIVCGAVQCSLALHVSTNSCRRTACFVRTGSDILNKGKLFIFWHGGYLKQRVFRGYRFRPDLAQYGTVGNDALFWIHFYLVDLSQATSKFFRLSEDKIRTVCPSIRTGDFFQLSFDSLVCKWSCTLKIPVRYLRHYFGPLQNMCHRCWKVK